MDYTTNDKVVAAINLLRSFSTWMADEALKHAKSGNLQPLVDSLAEIAEIYQDEAEAIACI